MKKIFLKIFRNLGVLFFVLNYRSLVFAAQKKGKEQDERVDESEQLVDQEEGKKESGKELVYGPIGLMLAFFLGINLSAKNSSSEAKERVSSAVGVDYKPLAEEEAFDRRTREAAVSPLSDKSKPFMLDPAMDAESEAPSSGVLGIIGGASLPAAEPMVSEGEVHAAYNPYLTEDESRLAGYPELRSASAPPPSTQDELEVKDFVSEDEIFSDGEYGKKKKKIFKKKPSLKKWRGKWSKEKKDPIAIPPLEALDRVEDATDVSEGYDGDSDSKEEQEKESSAPGEHPKKGFFTRVGRKLKSAAAQAVSTKTIRQASPKEEKSLSASSKDTEDEKLESWYEV